MSDSQTGTLTHSRVLKIAFPIVLSNATVPILGAVDTGVVGQLGQAAPIGAVGIGAVILGAIYWMFGFLRMGTTGMAAQALGAGDRNEAVALLVRALLIGFAAGVGIIILQVPLMWAAFQVSPASDEVERMARDYMQIRIWSAPAAVALYGISGWLIAKERTRSVLVLQFWVNGVNIGLDLWFVLGLGWGVQGVAIATFLAEWSGLVLGLWLCRSAFIGAIWRDWARIFDFARLKQMAVVNGDIMLRSVLLQVIFISFLFFGADFGDVPLAANQVLLQFLFITAYAMDGFAISAETLVGQALGANNRMALRQSAALTSFWGLVTVIILSLAFWAFGGGIIDLMTTAPDVRAEARLYLVYMIVAPVLGVASWMLDGIFIGATRTRDMRNMMALSFIVYAVSIAVLVPMFGNHGLWLSLLISFVARGVTLGLKYPGLEAQAQAGK
jgi:MATE family multidrug resistance protein